MIKTMASISTDDCIPVLEADGVFIIENYVPDCSNIYSQAMQLCNEHGNPYEFGTAYRGGSINSHKPPIKSLFTAQWMKELHQKYNKTKGKFGSDVFATHDFKNNDGLA
ncbi:MAG TPA: hypothetical protein VKN14_09325, partial [Flavobacteriaceae bacterium]|nr:hypothetical protein [Flavobacteriaceae bacterium]